MLPPAPFEQSAPLFRVQRADGHPALDGDGIGFFQQFLESVHRHCETEVGRHLRTEGDDTLHTAMDIEHRPAAVAGFDGDGQLNHGPAVDFRLARHDAANDAVLQPARMPQGDDALPFPEIVGVAEIQSVQSLGVDLDQSEIEGPIGSVHAGDGILLVAEVNRDRPRFADDVQVGGDEPVGGHDEAGAEATLLAVAGGVGDDGDGRFGLASDVLDRFRGAGWFLSAAALPRDDGSASRQENHEPPAPRCHAPPPKSGQKPRRRGPVIVTPDGLKNHTEPAVRRPWTLLERRRRVR